MVRDEFLHAEIEHSVDHDALRGHISIQCWIKSVFQTTAKEHLVRIDLFLLVENGLTTDKYVFHGKTFLFLESMDKALMLNLSALL